MAVLRGGVFIGVDRTGGGLPELHAAASGAAQLYEWAISATGGGIRPEHAVKVTDEKLPNGDDGIVTTDQVYDAVQSVVAAGVDQLFVYFAGHGLIINSAETWLLSKAPLRADAAISVVKSQQLAACGRTPHVVIISDACRTPAQHLDTQSIIGVSAFANYPNDGPEQRVEVFYATAPGQAAAELNTSVSQGIYTATLLEAFKGHVYPLHGAETDLLQQGDQPGKLYIWSEPLANYLKTAVPTRLSEMGLSINQAPRAAIPCGRGHWLAEVDRSQLLLLSPGGAEDDADLSWVGPGFDTGDRGIPHIEPPSLRRVAEELIASAQGDRATFEAALCHARELSTPGVELLVDEIAYLAAISAQFDPDTAAAVRVQGAEIVVEEPIPGLVPRGPAALALDESAVGSGVPFDAVVEFDNGTVAVLPVLPGYVATVILREREIVSLSYESTLVADPERLLRVRQLRAVVTAAVRQGHYELAGHGIDAVRPLQMIKDVDPAMAVLAAYGYHELQEYGRIRRMDDALRQQLGGFSLFDVSALAGRGGDAVPFLPMLSQGWELIDVLRIGDTGWLDHIRPALVSSMWTLCDGAAAGLLRDNRRSR